MDTVVLNGFFIGLLYGLLAVGLVVIYRGSRVINFAYGETGMLAAFIYTDLRLHTHGLITTDRGLWPALPLAVLLAAALGAAAELLIARPLRNAPRLTVMVGTFALGALFLTFAIRRWTLDPRATKPLVAGAGWKIAGLQVQPQQLLILVVSAGLLIGLGALYRYSAFGLRLRATAQDPLAASLVGININVTSLATWTLAGALAGLSAILVAPLQTFQVLFMDLILIRAVAASLVGGLTSIGGAFGAGIILGIAEAVIAYKSPITGVTEVAMGGVILTLTILRPQGLIRSTY
jgi:branched-chain amino acid transport system permease protein